MSNLTVKDALRKMSEYDLHRNINKGAEYTGFNRLYCEGMMEKKHVIKHGHVYDVSKTDKPYHLVDFLKKIQNEETYPEVIMTSGTFLSMNRHLQKAVAEHLKLLAEKGIVKLYVGDEKVLKLFKNSNVQVKTYNRDTHFIIHFVKTKNFFIFVMPHNEEKLVRVDISSDTFEPLVVNRILTYFDKLIAEFDEMIEKNNRMGNNVRIASPS
jgi:hypothetical protein